MRKLLALVVVPALLTGCGVVAPFIPPIDVGDPFALDGREISLPFGGAETASAGQAASRARVDFTTSFDDVELDLRGFSLASVEIELGLYPTATLTRADTLESFPASFTLTRSVVEARVSDEVHGEATLATERQIELEFARDDSACGLASCSYAYTGGAEIADALSLEVSDEGREELHNFVAIIERNDQPTPNEGSFALVLDAESNPSLRGFIATFTLRSGGTTVRLGG